MKVLHLCASDQGGAARGAYNLHRALRQAGVDSWMLVGDRSCDDPTVLGPPPTGSTKVRQGIRQTWEYWPLKRYPHAKPGIFSPAIARHAIVKACLTHQPDIINLQWIGHGFLSIEAMAKLQLPLVWTLRDMWAFTGGCHYADDCTRYQQACGTCPHLGSKREQDLSRRIWRRKQAAWRELNLTLVPISHWLEDCVHQSSLLRHYPVQMIYNAIDTTVFRPVDRDTARHLLRLPTDKQLILFGALQAISDPRKGFNDVTQALQQLAEDDGFQQNVEVVIFGASQPMNPPKLGFKTTYLGALHDDITLALAYSAADVTVVPSRQEAFGKTAAESLACGTPVVVFKTTGLQEIVDHQQNGYCATCFDPADLAQGIRWVLTQQAHLAPAQALATKARQKAEQCFSVSQQAQAYQHLYEHILSCRHV